jgi:hypothetical protein
MLNVFAHINITDWDRVKTSVAAFPAFAFRGQACKDWGLTTALERAADIGRWPSRDLWSREQWILHQFKRRAHLMLSTDGPTSDLEWLALIQHFGGPTRLLDVTYSFYVAMFFALEAATTDAAVWAINLWRLDCLNGIEDELLIDERQKRYRTVASQLIENRPTSFGVLPVEPYRLNERMATQQGFFLLPRDPGRTFFENLNAVMPFEYDARHNDPLTELSLDEFVKNPILNSAAVIKFVVPHGLHNKIMRDLSRMNVDATSLFPGLDGFARSMKKHLRYLNDA